MIIYEETEMKITFIGHSGYLVELPEADLLFDYYQEELPHRDHKKPLYIFASHTHSDHFNPQIFTFSRTLEPIHYVLSKDIADKVTYRNMLDMDPQVCDHLTYMKADEELDIEEGGASINVRTLRSTDCGVAFLVECSGRTIFHAGDLYLWCWTKGTKEKNNNMKARFADIIKGLSGRTIDAAFLPLDPRLEEYYCEGFLQFLSIAEIKHAFPMHMWKHHEVIERFLKEERSKPYRDRIAKITERGQQWIIE